MSMDLPDAIKSALDSAFAGARPGMFPAAPPAANLSPAALLDSVVSAFGVNAGAVLAGVDRRTVQRARNRPEGAKPWKPKAGTLDKLRGAYEAAKARHDAQQAERARSARASVYGTLTARGGSLVLDASIVVSNDVRNRTLKLGSVFTPASKRAVVDAYLAGDHDKAADAFNRALNRDYLENPSGRGAHAEAVNRLNWR